MTAVAHRRAHRRQPRNARARGPRDRAWAFLLPAYGAIIAVVGIPTVYSLYLSFHQWKLTTFKRGVPFVGFDNYAKATRRTTPSGTRCRSRWSSPSWP